MAGPKTVLRGVLMQLDRVNFLKARKLQLAGETVIDLDDPRIFIGPYTGPSTGGSDTVNAEDVPEPVEQVELTQIPEKPRVADLAAIIEELQEALVHLGFAFFPEEE